MAAPSGRAHRCASRPVAQLVHRRFDPLGVQPGVPRLGEAQVAALLGLVRRSAVTVYRSRYPEPVRTSEGGRCLLWLRQDVEAWARTPGRLPPSG